MGLLVAEDRICDAERELGRTLPGPLRDRLMRENGGEIATAGYPSEDAGWELHSVWDPSDSRCLIETAGTR